MKPALFQHPSPFTFDLAIHGIRCDVDVIRPCQRSAYRRSQLPLSAKYIIEKQLLVQMLLPLTVPLHAIHPPLSREIEKTQRFQWPHAFQQEFHPFLNHYFVIHIFCSFHFRFPFMQNCNGSPHQMASLIF